MPQAAADSRWITVREPFNYYWPSRAVTHFSADDLGEHRVKNEVADFAIAQGKATEGKVDGSEATPPPARKRKVKRVTKRKAAGKTAGSAKASDSGPVAPVGDESAADADRAADRPSVAADAE
jgi:hypothetical protein